MDYSESDERYQDQILPLVSRSFALTIPQLPAALRTPVANAYLLCRIADTIEDETALSAAQTRAALHRFVAVVRGEDKAARLASELAPLLCASTLAAERELVRNMERVIRVTAHLEVRQRRAIERCVEVMCRGMHQFQETTSLRGLPFLSDLDEYCYYVAGVVGQLLTELFCSYSVAAAQRRGALNDLAISFAQGLQMTNILKDMWEDRSRGACWLPQEVFTRHGVDLERLAEQHRNVGFGAALSELVGITHAHLRNALAFTLLIPREETGIRLFCLWAIGLAVLTLRNIERTPDYIGGSQVKVSHFGVAMLKNVTGFAVRNDRMLGQFFDWAARGLPLASPAAVRRPLPTMHQNWREALETLDAGS